MNLKKPDFWDLKKKNLYAILLLPLSAIYFLALSLKKKIIKKKKFKVKIICVGNIYLGGTGKTPLSIKLAQILKKKFNLAVIKKNYSDQQDEISLLKKYCTTITDHSRERAIQKATDKNYNLLILDDGFQDTGIIKDLSIICFSSEQGVGNGLLLPAGPLRDSLETLKNADIALINGYLNLDLEKIIKENNPQIKIFYSRYEIINVNKYKNKNYFIFSGIGNNINFLKLLKKNNISVIEYKFFPDHYCYKDYEIDNLKETALKKNLTLLTTEKDYVRLTANQQDKVEYLTTELIINDEEKLIKELAAI